MPAGREKLEAQPVARHVQAAHRGNDFGPDGEPVKYPFGLESEWMERDDDRARANGMPREQILACPPVLTASLDDLVSHGSTGILCGSAIAHGGSIDPLRPTPT